MERIKQTMNKEQRYRIVLRIKKSSLFGEIVSVFYVEVFKRGIFRDKWVAVDRFFSLEDAEKHLELIEKQAHDKVIKEITITPKTTKK